MCIAYVVNIVCWLSTYPNLFVLVRMFSVTFDYLNHIHAHHFYVYVCMCLGVPSIPTLAIMI